MVRVSSRRVATSVVMVPAQTARQQQVSLVGSETLYNRLDKKLADLEVDAFFYNKQCKLFVWRYRFLKENINYRGEGLSFLSTQCVDQVLKTLDAWKICLEKMPERYLSLGLGC